MNFDPSKMHRLQLEEFAGALTATAKAMEVASIDYGIETWASVVPGKPIQITLDYVVPMAQPAFPYPPAPVIQTTSYAIPEVVVIHEVAQPVAPKPEPQAADPAPLPAKPNWTQADDKAAIDAYVASILASEPIKTATENAAYAVGRPLEGTRWRLKNVLADQLAEALKIASEIPAPPVADPSTAPAEDNRSGEAADAPKPTPPAAPVPAPTADLLDAHLADMPRNGTWTPERDLDLARMSVENGWSIQDIAVDFGMDAGAVKDRWDALTGLHRDPKTDKLVRRFVARDVMDRLQQMIAV